MLALIGIFAVLGTLGALPFWWPLVVTSALLGECRWRGDERDRAAHCWGDL